jgi:uncharacterized Zn finger protein (UPF0148 family)
MTSPADRFTTQETTPDSDAIIPLTELAPLLPLPNYTLSSVCPACGTETFKLACKVRCARCGFIWDCSEL